MADNLIAIDPPPGVFRNGTKYQARGRWYDSHLVRWHNKAIRPWGGWGAVTKSDGVAVDLTGTPRHAIAYRDASTVVHVAGTIGPSATKLYVFKGGTLTDVTPAGITDGAVDGAYTSASSGEYGSGPYGKGLYGVGGTGQTLIDADTWHLDSFGLTLVALETADGKLYSQSGVGAATQITNSPTSCRALVVTPERFLFALGASGDPRLVKWADQETLTTWTATADNKAGEFPLSTHGRLLKGLRTTRETLLWTDADVWAATFIGGDLVYGFEQRGDHCGLFAPHAATVVGPRAYWMGEHAFFEYDGAVREVPCDVSDFVFGHMNRSQRAKICTVVFPEFSTVAWFYPSVNQTGAENDRYVEFNYLHRFWSVGALARAAGHSAGASRFPVLFKSDGTMFEHEVGEDRESEVPYLESGPIEIGQGDQFMDVQRLIPDENTLGDVQATFYATLFPTDAETTYGPFSLAAPTDVRFVARHARVRLTQNRETGWRVGVFRLGVVPGERR